MKDKSLSLEDMLFYLERLLDEEKNIIEKKFYLELPDIIKETNAVWDFISRCEINDITQEVKDTLKRIKDKINCNARLIDAAIKVNNIMFNIIRNTVQSTSHDDCPMYNLLGYSKRANTAPSHIIMNSKF